MLLPARAFYGSFVPVEFRHLFITIFIFHLHGLSNSIKIQTSLMNKDLSENKE